jgi:hypothetical protein
MTFVPSSVEDEVMEKRPSYGDEETKTYQGDWMGFSPGFLRQLAREEFVKRYGVPPAQVRGDGGGVYAGPIPGTA